jgi:hypothetical protein
MDEELRQRIFRMVEENERTIQRYREEGRDLERFLRESERRTERARRKLRQAGVLK